MGQAWQVVSNDSQRWKAANFIDKAEIYHDGLVRVGLLSFTDKSIYSNLDFIKISIAVANTSKQRIMVQRLDLE